MTWIDLRAFRMWLNYLDMYAMQCKHVYMQRDVCTCMFVCIEAFDCRCVECSFNRDISSMLSWVRIEITSTQLYAGYVECACCSTKHEHKLKVCGALVCNV